MISSLGIIGGGVMGEALLARLLAQGQVAATAVTVSEPFAARCEFLNDRYGVRCVDDNAEAAQADWVLLAIKPQVFDPAVAGLADLRSDRLILSILAGVPLAKLEAAFPHEAVIRAMPNTPATVGAGVTAIAAGQQVTADQLSQAQEFFAAVGRVVTVPESQLDAVTGLSGSGPGYVALIVEALSDGGVAAGLPRAIATELAIQTVRGTAELLQETGWHPGELKDRVCSPGGTTIAGVATLEQNGLRSALIEAVKAAALRSQQLG
ncbi:pyrroline-5-carboxylate reductase [Synechococcus elongatus]|uniref:Pyrroline-5-carboxylate reductase n=1 Tax=Synechococcus elongatus (strain ATCC 33912 / PCC 7942 / FACHB-805) TaxID=1140 RepID=Q31LI1_SYNE7|nr:pyrroline-5-carboxylate reductase [Synechococcus elongatus]ABB58088.1 pyrroline-5-carboxylate reductase [Synechococcus elongatus PCC 7942 = FACHB-805]AJD57435.1 Pyrroline-5-carboxylate reductase [Synechococcus elongatus UTEX 2973]MBD2586807.1 pyrroline-5-carboxylate reductase [Synechococcus elongatus FACHB-242]MBD2687878.1 pyrroline-5-carboxylate reductase [Synechococcus elongatus FACHB-1061]MBD2706411.1 pyrroline-5-carboxylate reductase [Synechococcus elongatus PCC 7942 = FACHB-805]